MPLDPDLAEELEVACLDAMRGDPYGPSLARRLERECIQVLERAGVRGGRVVATSDRRGTFVRILLPAAGRRVEEVVLRVT